MSNYLVVARQTATSQALLDALRSIAARDPKGEFTLLVPATPVEHRLTWTEGESIDAARTAADAARVNFERSGVHVASTIVGDAAPLQAIADVLAGGGRFDAIVISTLPPGVSRWLKLDIRARAERQFGLPVIPVIAAADDTSAA